MKTTELLKTDLTNIPSIGINMAKHLMDAGYANIASLIGQNPDEIYTKDCIAQGMHVDRCALYCYRLAVHFADHDGVLPSDKLNWWDWKD